MDFDGTLKPLENPVSGEDKRALQILGDRGLTRVIATGRTIKTFMKDWEPAIAIDYLISSTGLGISKFNLDGPAELLVSRSFDPETAAAAIDLAKEVNLGFFLSFPPPETHVFYYSRPEKDEPSCFTVRLTQYEMYGSPYRGERDFPLAQVLIMGTPQTIAKLRSRFDALVPPVSTVISTSPYGDGAHWLEIYPPQVSKGHAAAKLASLLGLDNTQAVALGNDFNDRELLDWAGISYISSQAPLELKSLYRPMPPAGKGPLAFVLDQLEKKWQ
jgi:hydroxymethylpyrimidine pyrophosphatase-like HAD family hydrolase